VEFAARVLCSASDPGLTRLNLSPAGGTPTDHWWDTASLAALAFDGVTPLNISSAALGEEQ
jgi:hypothetical protein